MRNSPGPTSDPRGLPARAGHGPDASPRDTLIRATLPAASPQALCALHSDHQTPLSLAPSLPSTASHPRVGSGNVSRPLLRVGPAIPPPSPTPAHGSHCPPIGRFAAASAFGAAPSARGFAASVSRPIYRVPCRVYIPLSTFPILLSLFQRVACLPNRLASSRRG